MQHIRITHCFTQFRSLGGVEAILRGHWENEAKYGLDSNLIIFFEPPDQTIERVEFLGFTADTTIRKARNAFANAIAKHRPEICIYHGSWGLHYFVDLDACDRRVIFIHGTPPNYPAWIRFFQHWADGIVSESEPQHRQTLEELPGLDPVRLPRLFTPYFPPPSAAAHAPLKDRPFVIGYCGRITTHEKRLDRTPAFVKALEEAGINYRFELTGGGDLEEGLKEEFRGNSRVAFLGRLSRDDFWKTLASWDASILFSDAEGTPISILETMDRGIIPIMPGINSGADYYARLLGEEFVYTPHDFTQVAKIIRSLQSRSPAEIDAIRQKSRDLVSPHRPENYFEGFASFIDQVLKLPRRSSNVAARRPWPINSLSFRALGKLSRARSFLRKFGS